MIGELQKRPESKHRKTSTRPITGQVKEANRRQSNECFEMGKEHMNKGEYQKALQHYFNSTLHDPNNYKAFCNMGAVYRSIGNFNQAKKAYLKSLKIKKDDLITIYNYGNVLRITGDDELAQSQYERVIKLKEEDKVQIGSLYVDSLVNLGICFKNIGLYDEAIKVFDKVITLKQNDESGHFNKAMCYLKMIIKINVDRFGKVRQQMFNSARNQFEKTLSINPQNYSSKVALIELKYLQEPFQPVFQQSIEQLKSLQSVADDKIKEYINMKLGYCFAALKKFKQSSEYYRQGGITEDAKSIKQSIKRQTQYGQFPKVIEKSQRPGTGKELKKDTVEEMERPKTKQSMTNELESKGRSKKEIFYLLLNEQKFEEAFTAIKEMGDGLQKSECEIILNFRQAEITGDQIFFSPTLTIYKEKILNNDQSKQVTKDLCSIQCHQALATTLTYLGNHEQATKHYQVLAEHFRDEKMGNDENSKKELERLYGEMGYNYAQMKLWDKAIEEYKKQLNLEPHNYFVLSNLAECFIENEKVDEALKLFEDYMKESKVEEQQDKAQYIDCLLNISMCLKGKQEEFNALERAENELQKYFPSYEEIAHSFQEINIENLYLRLTELYEEKYNSINSTEQKKQINERLLDLYLSCLQFPTCPDREEININCANLFYLNKNYANALNFYRKVEEKKHLVANNIGLTLSNLQEHDMALSCLQYARQNSIDNPIYEINFIIMKWMYGIVQENDSNQLLTRYPSRCEPIINERIVFGLSLIDKLTQTIVNEESIGNIDIKQTLSKIIKLTEQGSSKTKFAKAKIDQYCKQVDLSTLPSKYIIDDLLKICLQPLPQFQNQCSSIVFPKIQSLPKNMLNVSATQLLVYTLFIVNHDKKHQIQTIIQSKILRPSQVCEIQTKAFAQSGQSYLNKVVQIKYPNIDLSIRNFYKIIREIECIIETNNQLMLQHINNVYYQNTDNILSPLRIERMYPHSQNIQTNQNGFIKLLNCIYEFTGIQFSTHNLKFTENGKNIKDKFIKNAVSSFFKEISNHKAYDSKAKTFTLTTSANTLPIIVKTHHKTKNDMINFVRQLDQEFSNFNIDSRSDCSGMETVIINRSLKIDLLWGQISELQKCLTSIHNLHVNPIIVSILSMGDDLNILSELCEDEEVYKHQFEKLLHLKD